MPALLEIIELTAITGAYQQINAYKLNYTRVV